ncbi:MCE family protein [Nitriliruptoraceae bacterium ZYF776]|nr:MCE family protein [Profundirhabdus halotolerans]
MDPILVRRILGTAAVVLVVALGYLGLDWRYAPAPGSYEVVADLGRAGSGVNRGTDVKVRGVTIGQVREVRFVDGRAEAVMVLDPEPRLPSADQLDLAVTAKTLLGEKQIELGFDDAAFDEPPYLAAGDTITASRGPTEVTEAIDALEPFIAAIDPQDLATIVDTLGDQRGEGEAIAENIELGQELAAFADRTSDDAFARMRDLADVTEALTQAVPDLTRLNTELPAATVVLVERQADLRANLETVSRASRTLTRFLEVEESVISRFVRTSQPVGDVLERQADEIGNLINGVFLYSRTLGGGGILLDDGSELAGFRIFVDPGSIDPVNLLCAEFEAITEQSLPLLCEGG